MISIRSAWILGLLIIFTFQENTAQNIDSLLTVRDSQLQEYVQFKEKMGERTWIKLVRLSNLASNIIKTDNKLVDYYFSQDLNRSSTYKAEAEELNLEITLLKEKLKSKNLYWLIGSRCWILF